MLKRLDPGDLSGAAVPVGEAEYPMPLPWSLEYCAPVYESWNIVHIGMLLPESHQIYICADNCMRGVTMTAAEMGQQHRFHCVILEEKDMLYSNLEQVTIDGVSDVLKKLEKLPPAVLVFTVCVHHFLGTDMDYVYRELEKRWPSVTFIRCWMDPVMQKNHRMPDVWERQAMLDIVPASPAEERSVNLLGADLPHDEESELRDMLRRGGYTLRELPRCRTYKDFLDFGKSALNLVTYPSFRPGAEAFGERLGRPVRYVPPSFDYEEIDGEIAALSTLLQVPAPDVGALREQAEQALRETRERLGDRPVYLDYIASTRPLGMARLLLDHGFRVERVYIDAVGPEEEETFRDLKARYPGLMLYATIRPKLRVLPRGGKDVLAVGPKAAFFADTPHFVDMIEGDGLWGYTGIIKLCKLMREAAATEKDVRDHVIRKGKGWVSLI